MSAISGNDPEFNAFLPKPSAGRGFKLIEVLAVLFIIALLIALLLPLTRSAAGLPHAGPSASAT
jgi:prepilin-type N-terminal cleavage/methylation domain-containing protein